MPPSKESPPSVSHLTESCISKFKHLINSGGSNEQESLETRLADFNLWADGVGATAKLGASLDTRFHARPDDLLLVKGTLTMLADFLDEYAILASDRSPTDEAIINVDSSIRNLAMIGVAIRRTGKASRSRRADRLFDRAEHQELRRHLECIVLLRPSETQPQLEDLDASKVNELIASNAPQLNELVVPMLERLVECRMSQLGASKLSVVQNRLIEANLRRRHRFLLAQRRSRHSRADQVRQVETDNPPDKESSPRTGPVSHLPVRAAPSPRGKERSSPTIAGLSTASTAEGTLQYKHNAAKKYTPSVARSQISLIAADTEFPKPPKPSADRLICRCPCCCQSLPSEEFINPKRWKQHLIEDLNPYTCVAEHCPAPDLLFATRKAWETHVKKDHPPQWQCPLCDDEQDTVFLLMMDIQDHLRSRHQEALSNHSLSTLVSWSTVQHMGIRSCPLCSSHGPQDSPELVDHVVRHAYEFALRALPWPVPPTEPLNKPIGTYTLPGEEADAKRLEEWIDDASSDTVEELELSSCDRADHGLPGIMDPVEDENYFAENGYFEEQSVARSSKAQSRSSLVWSQTSDVDPVAGSSAESSRETSFGIKALDSPEDSVVDIVFIHGLTGDREGSWTAPGASEPWPKTLLPSVLPIARILLFGYNAVVAKWQDLVSETFIRSYALHLLKSLASYREDYNTNERPIIFICHSLGGVVCKDALILSNQHQSERHLHNILRSTCGIVFLGTPHYRSGLIRCIRLLSQSIGIRAPTDREIADAGLTSDLDAVARIHDDFYSKVVPRGNEGQPIDITCFYEELPLARVGLIVVTKEEATLGCYSSIAVHGNHMDMTKLSSRQDLGFWPVHRQLLHWTNELMEIEASRSVKAAKAAKAALLPPISISDQATWTTRAADGIDEG